MFGLTTKGGFKQSASGQHVSKDDRATPHKAGFLSGNFRAFCIP